MTAQRRDLLRLEVPLGLLGGALVALAFVFAQTGIPSWIPPAPLVRLRIPSPLTGMTRSFMAFAQGDVAAAFAFHPLGPVCFMASVAAFAVGGWSWLRGRRSSTAARILSTRTTWLIVSIAVAGAWARQVYTRVA